MGCNLTSEGLKTNTTNCYVTSGTPGVGGIKLASASGGNYLYTNYSYVRDGGLSPYGYPGLGVASYGIPRGGVFCLRLM